MTDNENDKYMCDIFLKRNGMMDICFLIKYTIFLLNKKGPEDFPIIILGELWRQIQVSSLNKSCFPGMEKLDISWKDH